MQIFQMNCPPSAEDKTCPPPAGVSRGFARDGGGGRCKRMRPLILRGSPPPSSFAIAADDTSAGGGQFVSPAGSLSRPKAGGVSRASARNGSGERRKSERRLCTTLVPRPRSRL
jgi:hypothetical protein